MFISDLKSITVVLSILAVAVSIGQTNLAAQAAAGGSPAAAPAAHLTPPSQTPMVVRDLAQGAARTILDRRDRRHAPNPEQEFSGLSQKIAIFAVAAVLAQNPAETLTLQNKYIAAAESSRTDKQSGSSASALGSTSPVEKAGLPELLNIAIEHGAVEKQVNGNTLTLSSSPYALVAALKGDTAENYQHFSGYTRFGLSAAFNLEDQSNILASARRKQLAEWSVRLRLLGDRSARSTVAQGQFEQILQPHLQTLTNTLANGLSDIFNGTSAGAVLDGFSADGVVQIGRYLSTNPTSSDAQDQITSIILDLVMHDLYGHLNSLNLTSPALPNFLARYKAATDAYLSSSADLDKAIAALEKLPTLSLAYFNERSVTTPNYSVVKLLYEKKPEGFMQITANAGASFYVRPDRTKNQQTFRDFQIAVGLQQKLGRSPFLTNSLDKNPVNLSFNGRYQRLQENRHVSGKKADIGVVNVKLVIPFAAGMSFPLSFTYATATELVKEKDVRGNFGITFDLDKLYAIASAH